MSPEPDYDAMLAKIPRGYARPRNRRVERVSWTMGLRNEYRVYRFKRTVKLKGGKLVQYWVINWGRLGEPKKTKMIGRVDRIPEGGVEAIRQEQELRLQSGTSLFDELPSRYRFVFLEDEMMESSNVA